MGLFSNQLLDVIESVSYTHLQEIYSKMTDEDILIITADHGCDPTTSSTDHSREHIPEMCIRDRYGIYKICYN